MEFSEYKYYIANSLSGVVSDDHIKELKKRIKAGVNTVDEVYESYTDLYREKNGCDLMSYKVWFREQRFSKILDK